MATSTLEEKFRISVWPCNILYIFASKASLHRGTSGSITKCRLFSQATKHQIG